MKKNRKKRGFFGRLIVFLLAVLAFIGLIAMGLSVTSSYLDPVKFPWLAYFGLAFWVIFVYNVAVMSLLLLMWSKKIWISVLALLISIPGVYKSFSTGKSQAGGELRVISYNVMNFRDYSDSGRSSVEMGDAVANMVMEYQPDILCLQEFTAFMPKMGRNACIAKFGEQMDMPYQYYHNKNNFGGNVIFSRYPLTALEPEHPLGEEKEYGAVVQVDAGDLGRFYLINVHLTSFLLTNNELTVFSEKNSKEEVKNYGKSIIKKLKIAYEKRSQEVSAMLDGVPNDDSAIVLCGDFNDTPLSYTYHQIKREGFTDGFVKAGWGVGRTYAGKLPMLRIDYVWGNDRIQPKAFKRLKVKGSDHFPIMMDFNVNHGF